MNPIIFLLQLFLFNTKKQNEPVRLHKKTENPKVNWNIDKELQLLLISVIITIILSLGLLLLIPSCTDSGLIYNNNLI